MQVDCEALYGCVAECVIADLLAATNIDKTTPHDERTKGKRQGGNKRC